MQEYIIKYWDHVKIVLCIINTTTLTISNNEMNNIKLVKYLEDSDLCLKGVTKTAQTEVKE